MSQQGKKQVWTNTAIEVTGKCNVVAWPDQSDRSGPVIAEYIFLLRGGSKGQCICWQNSEVAKGKLKP